MLFGKTRLCGLRLGLLFSFSDSLKNNVSTTMPRMQAKNIMTVPMRLVFTAKVRKVANRNFQVVAISLVLYDYIWHSLDSF